MRVIDLAVVFLSSTVGAFLPDVPDTEVPSHTVRP